MRQILHAIIATIIATIIAVIIAPIIATIIAVIIATIIAVIIAVIIATIIAVIIAPIIVWNDTGAGGSGIRSERPSLTFKTWLRQPPAAPQLSPSPRPLQAASWSLHRQDLTQRMSSPGLPAAG